MSKSRRRSIRKQSQRRRKWHQRRRRREAFEAAHEAVLEKFSFRSFLRENRVPLFFIVLALAGITALWMTLPLKETVPDDITATLKTLAEEQLPRWAQKYSKGYKLIVITDQEIILTDYDRLPENLRADWKHLVIKRLKADPFKNIPERIQIELSGLSYAPADIFDVTASAAFTRQKGMTGSFLKFDGSELAAEIIEDQGNRIFCLFGLR